MAAMAAMACATPALADDETEKIGIAAALGLTAADGKTTLGDGAGAIEAALLGSDAINQAGAIIAALAHNKVGTGNVLLVTRSEAINAAAYHAVQKRIDALTTYAKAKTCPSALTPGEIKTAEKAAERPLAPSSVVKTPEGKVVVPALADILPALASSTSFAAVTLSIEDRALLSSILMNRSARLTTDSNVQLPAWHAATLKPDMSGANPTFILPSEVQGNPGSSAILVQYNAMLTEADRLRPCTGRDETAKATVSTIDGYAQSLNAVTDKAPVPPLLQAVQQEPLFTGGAPKILRVTIEQAGGTTRTSSSLWFTLGVPGSATVSAGLLVSFRLIDTATGQPSMAGIVRCAAPYSSMRSVERFARAAAKENGTDAPRKATCSYIAS